MSYTQQENKKSFDHLLRYVFKQLSKEEEAKMEDFLDQNQTYADLVDDILAYSLDNGLRTREALEENLAKSKEKLFDNWPEDLKPKEALVEEIIEQETPIPTKKSSQLWKIIVGIIITILLGFFVYQQITDEEKQDTQEIPIAAFNKEDVRPGTETLYENFKAFGGTRAGITKEELDKLLREKNFRQIRLALDKSPLSELDEVPRLYYGIAHVLDKEGDLAKGINILEGFRLNNSDYYPAASPYLITALVLNDNLPKARRIYQEDKEKYTISYNNMGPNILDLLNSD